MQLFVFRQSLKITKHRHLTIATFIQIIRSQTVTTNRNFWSNTDLKPNLRSSQKVEEFNRRVVWITDTGWPPLTDCKPGTGRYAIQRTDQYLKDMIYQKLLSTVCFKNSLTICQTSAPYQNLAIIFHLCSISIVDKQFWTLKRWTLFSEQPEQQHRMCSIVRSIQRNLPISDIFFGSFDLRTINLLLNLLNY